MERFILEDLKKWKESKGRKPLILRGARQVGKTWILKEFGKRYYDNCAYFNFDESVEYKQFFETTKNVERILQNLTMASGQKINGDKTLIFFDEIQECPNALNTLKYFCETAPQYHVVCAGSLLGIALSKPVGFPVGKTDFIDMYPMTFSEFLVALGEKNYVEYMRSISSIENIPDAFFNPLAEKLKMYFITGGMPEVVYNWVNNRDVEAIQRTLSNIALAYEHDFGKHPNVNTTPKISLVWKTIPSQLAKENKKFLYNSIKEGARAREYEDALQWLVNAGIVRKIYRCNKPHLPLSQYDDIGAFKILLGDVGLLRRISFLSPSAVAEGNRLFVEFKGALTENYILQAIEQQFEVLPRYWAMDKPRYEVDFLIQREDDIIPIEVKADVNIDSKSLKKYAELYPNNAKIRVRFSMRNLHLDGDVLNIPLFMADYADKLIALGLKGMKEG